MDFESNLGSSYALDLVHDVFHGFSRNQDHSIFVLYVELASLALILVISKFHPTHKDTNYLHFVLLYSLVCKFCCRLIKLSRRLLLCKKKYLMHLKSLATLCLKMMYYFLFKDIKCFDLLLFSLIVGFYVCRLKSLFQK